MPFSDSTYYQLEQLQQYPWLRILPSSHEWANASTWLQNASKVVAFADALEQHRARVEPRIDMRRILRPDETYRTFLAEHIAAALSETAVHKLHARVLWKEWQAVRGPLDVFPSDLPHLIQLTNDVLGDEFMFGTHTRETTGWFVVKTASTQPEPAELIPSALRACMSTLNTSTFYEGPTGSLWSFPDVRVTATASTYIVPSFRTSGPAAFGATAQLQPMDRNMLDDGYYVTGLPDASTDGWRLGFFTRPTKDEARRMLAWMADHASWVYLRIPNAPRSETSPCKALPAAQELDLVRYAKHELWNTQWFHLVPLQAPHAQEALIECFAFGHVRVFVIG